MQTFADKSKSAKTAKSNSNQRQNDINSPLKENIFSNLFPIQRKAACACGGNCPNCRTNGMVQAKSNVSSPDDEYEQEADQTAEKIMRMSGENDYQDEIAGAEESDFDDEIIYRKENSFSNNQNLTNSGKSDIPKSNGHSLSRESKSFFEPRFGANFDAVKIHTDNESADFAEKINARAYTIGNSIGFAKGEYQPETEKGRFLLAHELTHVIQQRSKTLARNTIQRQERSRRRTSPRPARPPALRIYVVLEENRVYAMRGEEVVREMRMIGGRPDHPTHTGVFSIDGSRRDIDHTSSSYGHCVSRSGRRRVGDGESPGRSFCRDGERYEGAEMPYFQPFNGSEGFHVGNLGVASHGCIHLREADAEWLWSNASGGTRVEVVRRRPPRRRRRSAEPTPESRRRRRESR